MATITLAKSATPAQPKVLPDLSKPSYEQLLEMIATQAAQLEAAKASRSNGISCKVSEKGALCIYGLGRWPVTLYISQFDKLNSHWAEVQAFATANAARFSRKE